jgi:hypothetical protein
MNGVLSASWTQLRSYLEEKVAASVQKVENTAVGVRNADQWHSLSAKVGTNFADKQVSLGRIVRSRTQATKLYTEL